MLSKIKIPRTARLFIVYLLALANFTTQAAEQLVDWWPTSNSVTLSNLNHVSWDGVRFHAVGEAGVIATSNDGVNWFNQGHFTRRPYEHTTHFKGKTYYGAFAENTFELFTIPNGNDISIGQFQISDLSINKLELDSRINVIDNIDANSKKILGLAKKVEGFTTTCYIISSVNGDIWKVQELDPSYTSFSMLEVFNDEFWLFSPATGELKKSPDGIHWQTEATYAAASNYAVTNFKVEGGTMFLAHSPDGRNWLEVKDAFPYGFNLRDIKLAQNRFVVVGDWGGVFISPDLTRWTNQTPSWTTER